MNTTKEPKSRALFVFFGIVGLSLVFFFLFTKKVIFPGDPAADAQPAKTAKEGPSEPADFPAGGVQPQDVDIGIPEQVPVPEIAPEIGSQFAEAPQPIRAFAIAAVGGSLEELLGEVGLPADEVALLGSLFQSGTWSLPQDGAPVLLGQFGDKHRWKLPLVDGSSSQDGSFIYLDLVREKGRKGWSLADVRIPPQTAMAALSAAQATGAKIDAAGIRTGPDSLMAAESFVQAVSNKAYARAIAISDLNSITREKIAGLFIIFEEGGYRLKAEKSLNATVATDDSAWVIGQIESEAGLEASDFGIELAQNLGEWKVTGLHFSKLLATFAAASSGPDSVPYTPIVENPAGGESLVLYFGYDEDMLHLRAQRQLSIVSALLRDDARKVIRITGHADALGSEDYNDNLSERRALAARARLIELGVPPKQVVAEGFGESAPAAENVRADGTDNPEGRSKNRRTEIFLDF
jgi:OOP family OmpA-OmpF porin